MNYFNYIDFHKTVEGHVSLFVDRTLNSEAQKTLLAKMQDFISEIDDGRAVRTISDSAGRSYFCKVTTLNHWHKKIRTTFGIKRYRTYYGPVAEIINNLRVKDVRYFPGIIGYGFQRNALGLICKVIVLTEHIDNAINVQEFIKNKPDEIFVAIDVCLNLIKKHIYDGFLHLDIWMGNVLLSEDLCYCWLIDVEYLRFNSVAPLEDQFGFCLGYFYKHTLSSYLLDSEYFNHVHVWCAQHLRDLDIDIMMAKTVVAGKTEISRRERVMMF